MNTQSEVSQDRALIRAYQFFFKHAGYVVGRRAEGALDMACAERAARDAGIVFVWAPDDDADASFVETWDPKQQKEWHASEHYAEWCRVVRPCPEHGADCRHAETLASLSGIWDADATYRRVVEAELALEAGV